MSTTSTLDQLTLYRGLYSRVAHKLGVDPSYVSRVARGDRSSRIVSDALEAEINKIGAAARSGKAARSRKAIQVKRGRA